MVTEEDDCVHGDNFVAESSGADMLDELVPPMHLHGWDKVKV